MNKIPDDMFNCVTCGNPDTIGVDLGGCPVCADHPEGHDKKDNL